jgi:hypothetical protein
VVGVCVLCDEEEEGGVWIMWYDEKDMEEMERKVELFELMVLKRRVELEELKVLTKMVVKKEGNNRV